MTKFPEQQGTSLEITADKPVQMAVRLRIPSWLKTGPTVKINGKALEATANPGSYLTFESYVEVRATKSRWNCPCT